MGHRHPVYGYEEKERKTVPYSERVFINKHRRNACVERSRRKRRIVGSKVDEARQSRYCHRTKASASGMVRKQSQDRERERDSRSLPATSLLSNHLPVSALLAIRGSSKSRNYR